MSNAADPTSALGRLTLLAPAPSSLKTFTLFNKLPFELRSQIWRYVITPRIISFAPGGGKPLALFSTCQESRNETRPLYDYLRIYSDQQESQVEFAFFINHQLDALNITGPTSIPGTSRHSFQLPSTILCALQTYYPTFMGSIRRLAVSVTVQPYLKTLFTHYMSWRPVKAACPMATEFLFVFVVDGQDGSGESGLGEDVMGPTYEEALAMNVLFTSARQAQERGCLQAMEVRFSRHISA